MPALKKRTTLLLNWYANPYHTPIFVAKASGFYEEEGIHLAILETTDPSDVTEIVGLGSVDIGLKAMIHTLAAKSKGFDVTSIGTLLDEPPTGLIALKSSGIRQFSDIVGKRVGYIGEFGKVIIEDLLKLANLPVESVEMVRIGMNVTQAIIDNKIDTGIGFVNFQQVELEALGGETVMLRLDELAGLGCCCFCSIQFISPNRIVQGSPELMKGFMRATLRGMAKTLEAPEKAYSLLCELKPNLNTPLYKRIYMHTLPFFSRNLLNQERDWEKVGKYTKHLGILPQDFEVSSVYSNHFVPSTPHCESEPIACCLS